MLLSGINNLQGLDMENEYRLVRIAWNVRTLQADNIVCSGRSPGVAALQPYGRI